VSPSEVPHVLGHRLPGYLDLVVHHTQPTATHAVRLENVLHWERLTAEYQPGRPRILRAAGDMAVRGALDRIWKLGVLDIESGGKGMGRM
jgi:hypothetical protein